MCSSPNMARSQSQKEKIIFDTHHFRSVSGTCHTEKQTCGMNDFRMKSRNVMGNSLPSLMLLLRLSTVNKQDFYCRVKVNERISGPVHNVAFFKPQCISHVCSRKENKKKNIQKKPKFVFC